MATLEQILQTVHDAGKRVEISWLWDGGVDVNAGGEERNFRLVSDIAPWLQHWYSLKTDQGPSSTLDNELQKIYDSEINITLRTGDKDLFVALGNDFAGFTAEGKVARVADVIPWFQNAIHQQYPSSKYDVERLGARLRRRWRRFQMDSEPDLSCPECGNAMELLMADEDGSLLRVCPACATLAWNTPDGAVEIREPHEVTGEEKQKLLENERFVTAEEELARLRNRKT